MKRIRKNNRTAWSILTAALILLIQSHATASTVHEGVMAYTKGNYEKAFKIWAPLARSGDSQAQYNLAMLYSTGKGVTKSDIEAAKWYQQAASKEHEYPRYKDGRIVNKAAAHKTSTNAAPSK